MKTAFRRTLLCAALALAASPVFAQSQSDTPESPFSQTVFFGDSLTDGGFFRPLLGPNGAVIGQFTTNPGYVWSQYMADYFHSNADVAWKATGAPPPGPYTTSANGNNWAVGGARVSTNSFGSLGYTPSLTSQYAAYLASGHTVDPNALYSVWGGANDIFAAIGAYQTAYANVLLGGGNATQAQAAGQAAAQPIVGSAVTGQIGLIGALHTAGAQYVLVPTLPDMGLTPDAAAGGCVLAVLQPGLHRAGRCRQVLVCRWRASDLGRAPGACGSRDRDGRRPARDRRAAAFGGHRRFAALARSGQLDH